MSVRLVYACLFTLVVGWPALEGLEARGLIDGVGLAGQQTPPGQLGDSLALAFEREVFAYPQYERRNPFRTLISAEGGGPRFESLLLLGILYSPFVGESIAVFGEGSRTINPATAAAPQSVTVDVTGGTYRVREGATLGNLTVIGIERDRVTIQLVEFGLTESRIMLLPRATP